MTKTTDLDLHRFFFQKLIGKSKSSYVDSRKNNSSVKAGHCQCSNGVSEKISEQDGLVYGLLYAEVSKI